MAGFGWKQQSNRTEIAPKLGHSQMGWRGSKVFPVTHYARGGVVGFGDQPNQYPHQPHPAPQIPGGQPGPIIDQGGIGFPIDPQQAGQPSSVGIQGSPGLGTSGGLLTSGITGSPGLGTSGGLMTPGGAPNPWALGHHYAQGGVVQDGQESYLKAIGQWKPKRVQPTIDDVNALTGYESNKSRKV